MSTPEIEQLLKRAITHVNAGELDQGRVLLEKILEQDPKNDRAWVWLSGCVDDPRQRLICLQQALNANPNNQAALDGMKVLDGELAQAPVSQPSLLESRLSAIGMGGSAASMPAPTIAPPPSPEAMAATPVAPPQAEGEETSAESGKKPRTLRIVLLVAVVLILLCVVCGLVSNFVVPYILPTLLQSS